MPRLLQNRYLVIAELLLIAYGAALVAVFVFEDYSMRLFFIGPLLFGCIAASVARKLPSTRFTAQWKSFLVIGVVWPIAICLILLMLMFVTGFEGAICLMMALIPVVAAAVVGGTMMFITGLFFDAQCRVLGFAWLTVCLIFFLLLVSVASAHSPDPIRVSTHLDIDAPPATVWEHVVAFSEIPEPEDWLFTTGLAYPIRARIEGEGVGAIRYCEFSTGPFVEPITVWDEPRKLAFDVTANPEPMREWSIWGEIHPPHLEGYLESEKGQFESEPLPGGRTRLTGTTWYQHGLGPNWYWTLWSDYIIHRIHLRVLTHIKSQCEGSRSDA